MAINNCVRCGRPRMATKTWEESGGQNGGAIKHTLFVCVDSECQKAVEGVFEANNKALKERLAASEKREVERLEARALAIQNARTRKVNSTV